SINSSVGYASVESVASMSYMALKSSSCQRSIYASKRSFGEMPSSFEHAAKNIMSNRAENMIPFLIKNPLNSLEAYFYIKIKILIRLHMFAKVILYQINQIICYELTIN